MSGKDADYEIKKQMFEEIKKFNKTEQEELYRILKRCGEELSENKNGIFFDLINLRPTTIQEIKSWIEFCNKNRATFETREKEIQELTEKNPGINEY